MRTFSSEIIRLFNEFTKKEIFHIIQSNQDDIHLTYSDTYIGACRHENILKKEGVEPHDIVIIILEHGEDLIYSYFGTILNGSIPSIMPFLTEKLHPEKYVKDLQALLEVTKPKAIITYQNFIDNLGSENILSDLCETIIISDSVSAEIRNPLNLSRSDHGGLNHKEKDIVLLQHSSGTTGLQKGVALSHLSVFNQLDAYREALQIKHQDDVVISWLPLYHDMGLIAGFLLPYFSAIPLVIMSPFYWVRAPYRLMDAITKYQGTLCWLPNFAYNFCAKKINERHLKNIDLRSMRAFINCSEPMRQSSHQMFMEKFSSYGLSESSLASSYAMAENVFAVTQGGIQEKLRYDGVERTAFLEGKFARKAKEKDAESIKMVSAGTPIKNVNIKIALEDGLELPERSFGEIFIKSNCMLTEYYKRDEITKKAFVDGWFKTGDIGYVAEGRLYVTGRKKDIIIVGGKNIYPKDLESITMEVEGVHEGRVVAFGVYNESKGTEDVVIIAEVLPEYEDRKKIIHDQIREQVTKKSAIALRKVLVVNQKWLIKTSSGKIARKLNKEKYLELY